MSQLTRRTFVLGSLSTAAGLTLLNTRQAFGASDTIRVAVAGLNGRGGAHVDAFAKMQGVKIVALIDPDTRTYSKRIKQVEGLGGNTPTTYQDVRKALEDKNIDVVSIATPNHWHALMTIWACQAGKDVYVEKPCSHNVREGRIAVEIARKEKRIVQHGTQNRSLDGYARLAALTRSGKLGKLLVSRGLCYKTRNSIGTKPESQPPAELDFGIWQGPAAERPFHTNLVHYNWHWFWDFGNGDIGNQGVHQMDVARWMIPDAKLPRSVISLGGRFGYSDQGETPNSQISILDYGETQLIFEVRGLKFSPYHTQTVGNILHFEEGVVAGDKFYPRGKTTAEPLPKVEVSNRGGDHFANFILAVRGRKQEMLNADILDGHYSSALCHLANISYRLGGEEPFNPQTKAFGDNREAYETLARLEEHLGTENKLNLDGVKYRLGRKLTIDAANENIAGDAEANRLMTREYRKPFMVPEKV
jgi:predicted dehydrogenase